MKTNETAILIKTLNIALENGRKSIIFEDITENQRDYLVKCLRKAGYKTHSRVSSFSNRAFKIFME